MPSFREAREHSKRTPWDLSKQLLLYAITDVFWTDHMERGGTGGVQPQKSAEDHAGGSRRMMSAGKFAGRPQSLTGTAVDRPHPLRLAEECRLAIAGGITMLQYRNKPVSGEAPGRSAAEAAELLALCRGAGIPFIIDDDIDLCMAVDADGVHIGQDDLPAAEARRRLGPGKILGLTAHNVAEAVAAEAAGADYLGCGAVFLTGSKAGTTRLSPAGLKAITDAVRIPAVAIGGITKENVSALAGTGIAGVATVSGVFGAEDIAGETAAFRRAVEEMV